MRCFAKLEGGSVGSDMAANGSSRPVVVLVCGLPGAGKSWLSHLATTVFPFHTRVFELDECFQRCVSADDRAGSPAKATPAHYALARRRLLDEVTAFVSSAFGDTCAIVDDVLSHKSMRHDYFQVAKLHNCRFAVIHVIAPRDCCRRRVALRAEAGNHASPHPVTPEVVDSVMSQFEAPPAAPFERHRQVLVRSVDSTAPVSDVVARLAQIAAELATLHALRLEPVALPACSENHSLPPSESDLHTADVASRRLVGSLAATGRFGSAQNVAKLRRHWLALVKAGVLGASEQPFDVWIQGAHEREENPQTCLSASDRK
jgi:tRNA uridine 5-carbamoylmethylation protein Kti12